MLLAVKEGIYWVVVISEMKMSLEEEGGGSHE